MEREVNVNSREKFHKTGSKSQGKKQKQPIHDVVSAQSEITIYDNAVVDGTGKRNSSSSEGEIDTSGEQFDVSPSNNLVDQTIMRNREITNTIFVAGGRRPVLPPNQIQSDDEPEQVEVVQPGIEATGRDRPNVEVTAEEWAAQLIKEAELSKARIFDLPGKSTKNLDLHGVVKDLSADLLHSVVVDENYRAIGTHVDQSMRQKIIKGEYIDFSKLIPRDRVLSEDDTRIHLVVKDGKIFPIPKD